MRKNDESCKSLDESIVKIIILVIHVELQSFVGATVDSAEKLDFLKHYTKLLSVRSPNDAQVLQ